MADERDNYRKPVPIEHTCDGTDLAHCECAKARQRQRRRERWRERGAEAREARAERQAQEWAERPTPRPRKVQMEPLVHTCDGTQPKRCECYRAWMREYQRRRRASTGRGPEINRRANLWRLYRVTPEEVDALRAAQGYRCAICGRHEDDLVRTVGGRPRLDGSRATREPLVVDHGHDGGQIRALLCNGCNTGLGHFGDDPDRLRAAASWLDRINGVVR